MEVLDICAISDGTVLQGDVLEYEGGFWLVPTWLETRAEGWMTPTRMIRLDTLPHDRLSTGDFVLKDPIPKHVFESLSLPEEATYEVILLSNIRVPIPRSTK